MPRVLELFDESDGQSQPTGDAAILNDDGILTFKGDAVRRILAPWAKDGAAEDVFNNFRGWSNGYVSLRERS